MSQDSFSSEDFSGTARLFPLPNLVMFPHVAQPLHIFEPRYRQMMADALEDDRLIAMALLRPGWESEYHNRPPIHPVVCLGRIHQEQELPDGRYNLLLQGLCRARVVEEEEDTDRLYRLARVELIEDEPASASAEEGLRQELRERVLPFFAAHPAAMEQLRRLVEGPMELAGLCDVFCFAMPLDTEQKQELLSEARVELRVRLLLRRLEGQTPPNAGRRAYPPKFSDN